MVLITEGASTELRRLLSYHAALPRQGVRLRVDELGSLKMAIDVADEEKVCDQCGREKMCLGEDVSRVLDFVPGQLEVHNHHLKQYACTCGKCGVTTAPAPPKPIEKCIAGRECGTSTSHSNHTFFLWKICL